MKKLVRAKLNKRGISIAEAVVAMAIIIAVSLAAITCIEAFSKTSANMNGKNEAVILCENALEVFKGTGSYSEYSTVRQNFVNYTPESGEEPAEEGKYEEKYTVTGCTVQIDLSYDSVNHTASFSAVLKDSKNHVVFNIDRYEKAVAEQP